MTATLMFGVKLREEGLFGFFKPRAKLIFCVRLPQRLNALTPESRWNCTYEYGRLPVAPTVMNCGDDAVVEWFNQSVRVTTPHFELMIPPEHVAHEEFAMQVELNGRQHQIRVVQFDDD
jgi:hypothetical protein